MEALVCECRVLVAVVGGLTAEDFARPTNCPPWNLQELVVHIADSITVGALPPSAPVGVLAREAADYYRRPERDTEAYRQGNVDRTCAHARAVLAYTTPGQWLEQSADATVTALSAADLDRVVLIKGVGPMRLADWVRTRVISVAAHGLDVALSLGSPPWTTPAALHAVHPVLVSLLGALPPVPLAWDELALLQTGTGRRPLTSAERRHLGPLAGRFPLLS